MFMKIGIAALFATMLGMSSLLSAEDKEKTEPDPAEVAQAQEIEKAESIIGKLSSYKKGKLTKLVKSGSKEDLMELPRVGEATAGRIIEARPLESSAHLVTVKGIGLKTLEKIVDYIDQGATKKKS